MVLVGMSTLGTILLVWAVVLLVLVGALALGTRRRRGGVRDESPERRTSAGDRRTGDPDRRIGLPDPRTDRVERRSGRGDRRGGVPDRRRSLGTA